MLLAIKSANRLDDIVERCGDGEVVGLKRAQAVFGQDEDGLGGASGEGGLTNTLDAIDHEARRSDGLVLTDGFKVKGH